LEIADSFARVGFLIDTKTLHNVKQLNHLTSRDTRKQYCTKVSDLFGDYISRWADKSVIGQFSVGRRGQMKAGARTRYGALKRDQEHAVEFGFVDSDEDGKTS
jgi:hypothetical protein